MKLRLPLLCTCLLFLSTAALASALPPAPVAQTGQTSCRDAEGTPGPCLGTGQDGERRAGLAWPNPRFSVNADQTVTDQLTGLSWPRDFSGLRSGNWQDALNEVQSLNTQNWLGHNDWRLPNINELRSLVHGETTFLTWLGREEFTTGSSTTSYQVWSSTSSTGNSGSAWGVSLESSYSMEGGLLTTAGNAWTQNKTDMYSWNLILPVRASASSIPRTGQTTSYGPNDDGGLQKGVAWPKPRFVDNGDTTISDTLTGLVWPQNANIMAARDPSFDTDFQAASGTESPGDGAVTWQHALDYVRELNEEMHLGYNDWRLPNRAELASLYDFGEASQTDWLAAQGFSTTTPSCWSSSTEPASHDYAMVGVGAFSSLDKKGKATVWPVRGGAGLLTVSKTGSGSGAVTASSGAIRWNGSTGIAGATAGGSVTLTATPSSGSDFSFWTGCDSESGNSCTVNLTGSKSVTANFRATPVAGLCGSAHGSTAATPPTAGLCTSGTASPLSGTGPWNWTCRGANGGEDAPCGMNLSGQSFVEPLGTGVTTCQDPSYSYATIPCAGTGQDGELQSGRPWPTPRFTDNSILAPSNQTITDNLTGLTWAKSLNIMATRDPDFDTDDNGYYNYDYLGRVYRQRAFDYVKKLNAENYLGHNDWRLPNANELRSMLAPSGSFNDWLGSQGFTAAAEVYEYSFWSSTFNHSTYADTRHVWPVRSAPQGSPVLYRTGQTGCWDDGGSAIPCAGTGQDGELQLGAAWPTPRFTDNGDQTITDNLTGLFWSSTTPSGVPVLGLSDIKELNSRNWLGHDDWRLPNGNERASLYNFQDANPVRWLSGHGFVNIDAALGQGLGYDSISYPVRSQSGPVALSVTSYTFPATFYGSTSDPVEVRVTNNGTTAATVTVTLAGTGAAAFSVAPGGTAACLSPAPTLAAGESCSLQLRFRPTGTGSSKATLSIGGVPTAYGTVALLSGFGKAVPVTPACGAADGGIFTGKPAQDLCLSGTASGVSGSGPWHWSCGSGTTPPVACTGYLSGTPVAPIPHNERLSCWDRFGIPVDCSGTGQEGEFGGGKYTSTRFTDNSVTNPSDLTVTDNLTGLVWAKDANLALARDPGYSGMTEDGRMRWMDAQGYVAKLNRENYLGHGDWRLPNRNEFASLSFDEGQTSNQWLGSVLQSAGFINIGYSYYWSSTTVEPATPSTSEAWTGAWSFYYGGSMEVSDKPSYYEHVWPVRGPHSGPMPLMKTGQTSCYNETSEIPCSGTGQDGELQLGGAWPTPRFTEYDNQTMRDNLTGLIWSKDPALSVATGPQALGGAQSWQEALDAIQRLNRERYLGYGDWRLPSASELRSLNGAATILGRLGLLKQYWSSSSDAGAPFKAWYYSAAAGVVSTESKTSGYAILPVRSGWYGEAGEPTLFPQSADFPATGAGMASAFVSFSIGNGGTADLAVPAVLLAGGDAADFSLAPGGATPCPSLAPTLRPGEVCTVAVRFNPAGAGSKSALLQVDTGGVILQSALTGSAVAAVDGSCGLANKGLFTDAPSTALCSPGAPTAVTGNGPWQWNCTGVSGGKDASCSAFALGKPALQLPKTGQTSCWVNMNPSLPVACAGTGQDGELQTGLEWPQPRFTGNGDGTLTDRLTGLVWTKDANAMSSRDPSYATNSGGSVSWSQALDYIKKLNSEGYLGHSDWRLPNANELRTLIGTQSDQAAWLTAQGFTIFSDPSSIWWYGSYWSSTTMGQDPAAAVSVGLNFANTWAGIGVSMAQDKKWGSALVWPVRAGGQGAGGYQVVASTGQTQCWDEQGIGVACAGTGQDGELQAGAAWPAPRFSTNADGTLTDHLTSLVWPRDLDLVATRDPSSQNSYGQMGWDQAPGYVRKLNQEKYLGHDDWRLPNLNELSSLANEQANLPWFSDQGFSNIVESRVYWTSTQIAPAYSYANAQVFSVRLFPKRPPGDMDHATVLPVRGGQNALDVRKSGNGAVTVSKGSLHWNGAIGSARYSTGETVSITAVPDPGYKLSAWENDCAGSALTCTVTMAAARSVTALFVEATPPRVTITSPQDTASLNYIDTFSGEVTDNFSLNKVSLSVRDLATGKYLQQLSGYFADAPANLPVPFGGGTWSLSILNGLFNAQTRYQLTVTTTDNAGNSATATSSFLKVPYYEPTGTAITSLLPSRSKLAVAESVDVTGVVRRNSSVNDGFIGKSVRLELYPPGSGTPLPNAASFIFTENNDTDGNSFTFTGVSGFNAPGTWTLKAVFDKSGYLNGSSYTTTIQVGPKAGYAIVVQGRVFTDAEGARDYAKTTGRIIDRLASQGFNVTYAGNDLGQPNDVRYFSFDETRRTHETPSKAEIGKAVTEWAYAKLASADPAPLYVVLVDHGNQDSQIYLEASDTVKETISAADLAGWLNTLEGRFSAQQLAALPPRVVVVGSCYSGTFIQPISRSGRIIIASAAPDQESSRGLPEGTDRVITGEYFIEQLFTHLDRGITLKEAFNSAAVDTLVYTRAGDAAVDFLPTKSNQTARQHPQLDDNGDGKGITILPDAGTTEGALAASMTLGVGRHNGENAAILDRSGSITLAFDQSSLPTGSYLWATVGNPGRMQGPPLALIRSSTTSTTGSGSQFAYQFTSVPLGTQGSCTSSSGLTTTCYRSAAGAGELAGIFQNPGTYDVFYYVIDNQNGALSQVHHSVILKNKSPMVYPDAPGLISPGIAAPGSTQETSFVTFSWRPVTPKFQGQAVTYTVEVGRNGSFNPPVFRVEGLAEPFYSHQLSDRVTDYCWRVKAVDQFGASADSATWNFSTYDQNGLPGVISGYVYDATTGLPVAGARISALNFTGTLATTLDNGGYLMVRSTGSYQLNVTASGFTPASASVIATAGKVSTVSFALTPASSGRPADCDGSGSVSIAEVQTAINMYLGMITPLACVDTDGNQAVSIAEVQKAINAYLGM
ncbi:MAG TPA: hypothetical protein DCZ75_15700 [Geobacter sp.]|nr:hypothetical protein [Geobacter sp.]